RSSPARPIRDRLLSHWKCQLCENQAFARRIFSYPRTFRGPATETTRARYDSLACDDSGVGAAVSAAETTPYQSRQIRLDKANHRLAGLDLHEQDSLGRISIFRRNSRHCVRRDRKTRGCHNGRFFVAPSETEIARFNPFTHCATLKSSFPRTKKWR